MNDGFDLFAAQPSPTSPVESPRGGAVGVPSMAEPAKPARANVGARGRHLIMDASEAGSISYEMLDRVIGEGRAEIEEWIKQHDNMITLITGRVGLRPNIKPPAPVRTRYWWSLKIILEMERLGLARPRLRFSAHAVLSIMEARWIWDRFAELGVEFGES